MKRPVLILLALLISLSSQAAPAKNTFDYLKSWAGKYPSDRIEIKTGSVKKNATSFFALPEIKQPLAKLLNKQDYKLLTSDYSVESPIEVRGDYLCVKNCRPHNCGDENAALSVDLRDGSMYVMMFKSDHKRWITSRGKYTDLPETVSKYMLGLDGQ